MTQIHSILGTLALGYAPLFDAQHQVLATRLTAIPLRPDARPDAVELLAALAEVWPVGGKPFVLSALSESLLEGLLQSEPGANLMLELPAFMVNDERLPALQALHKRGVTLLLKGRPLAPLSPALQACFKHAVLDIGDERGNPGNASPLPKLISGVRGSADIRDGFKSGASAVIGWTVEGAYESPDDAAKAEVQTDLQVIMQLMAQLDQGEDIEKLEATLKRDPSLAFKLLRYLNSAAFGLAVEVSSFRHAIMLLGYARLKRWLALLLATASKDHAMRPVMFAALRRGLLMEELSKTLGDSEARDEMFICGLFSLLDHMLKQPFVKLLQSIPMPERVRQALVESSGPFQPYLELLRAIEAESVFDYRQAAEHLMLEPLEINHAVLRALAKANQLE